MNKIKGQKPAPRHFLREWRQHKNLTQERAADQIGIKQSSLSRIENGKTPYDQAFLEAAAEAYGTTPGSLLTRNPLMKDAIWSLDDHLKQADKPVRDRIIAVVDTMLKAG